MGYLKRTFQIIVIVIMSVTMATAQQNNSYQLVYEADENGTVVSGSLKTLNDYVSKGYAVRVGWNMGGVYHWAEAMFITQYEGHVFAQIHSIFMQAPYPSKFNGKPEMHMPEKDPHGWSAIIGTTGDLEMKWNGIPFKWNKEKHKTEKEFKAYVRTWERGKAKTKWVIVK